MQRPAISEHVSFYKLNMLGPFSNFVNIAAQKRVIPEDIPPPTPICLPRYQPPAHDGASIDPTEALSTLLKSTSRSTAALGPLGLSAIGLDLKLDVDARDLIPDPSCIPDFEHWERLTPDEAQEMSEASRRPLRNGSLSPGCLIYLERLRELSNNNEDAFRTVRRIQPPKGQRQPRLGNAYELFRCLELFTNFWDDPTQASATPPPPDKSPSENDAQSGEARPQTQEGANSTEAALKQRSKRTADGGAMPPEFRLYLVAAFVKFVSYDFGCNVSMARSEPRLHLSSPNDHPLSRKSYVASSCQFVFQSPTTREAARAGLVYGPVAAVSARPTVDYTMPSPETAQALDLAREVVAALITSQHRAREGKSESRFGEGRWWTTKPRWGGGTGGPIGREIEKDALQGDKDAKLDEDQRGALRRLAKKSRKTMSIYDNYRMVRPPALTWDQKARYETIGTRKGAGFDDIFVVSSLFHHISIMRVRIPKRLLDVLDGAPDPDVSQRSWGKVSAWRSPWHDLFDTRERLAALRLLWAMMAYQMRAEQANGDVKMDDA